MVLLGEFLAEHDIATVEVCLVDLTGAIRGKRLPVKAFRTGALDGEVGFSSAVFMWDYAADVFTNGQYNWATGYPDIFLRPDLSTLRRVAWRPRTAFVVCDAVDGAGTALAMSPRRVLQRIVDELTTAGFTARIGLESEFYVLDPTTLRPRATRNPCYSLHADSDLEPMLAQVRDSLAIAGLEVEASGAEYGAGQVEINLRYADPVRAADDLVFFRYAVKQLAAQNGLVATFMPKPFTDSSGSGLHVHQSLWTGAGTNVFWDPVAGELSTTARHYLAGLLRHAGQTQAVAVPTPNGYKRIADHSFAPTTVSWGSDNRSTAVRALIRGARGTRLESRGATSDANPYLLTAMLLAAGLTGIRDETEPPPAVTTDAYTTAGLPPLPASPDEAARLLIDSTFARTVLGDAVVDAVAEIGRRETALYRSQVGDWERDRYLEVI